jgi:hypothetical protein
MSSTYSTNLALELIGAGDQAGNWGSTTNTNLGTLLEQAISGYTTQAVVTGTDVTLAMTNGASATARNMFLELTGTGGASTNLIVPANKKLYFIYNNSTGAVTVKVSGQTGISVPATAKVVLVSNGTDVIVAQNYIPSLISPTLTGTPIAPTATFGTSTTQIATTAFVQAAATALSTIYPIGSIYTSTVSTSPATLFGFGTWVNFGAGRVLISQDGTYPAGSTGGAATVSASGSVSGTVGGTSLTEAQMPKHYHQMAGPEFYPQDASSYPQNFTGYWRNFFGGTPDDSGQAYGTFSTGGSASSGSQNTGTSNGNSHDHSFSGSFTGSATSVVQPYISVYMWNRTA